MLLSTPRCAGCDRPGAELCRPCRFALIAAPITPPPAGVIVGTTFTGRVRDVLLGFKYGNRRAVSGHLAGIVVNRLVAAGVRPDLVTWAPTSSKRRQVRGFDQAELVARQVARQFGVPCRRLLARVGAGAPQTGRGRARRLDGPTFRAHPRAVAGHVVVLDDVVTTGATLAAARRCLRDAGAAVVTAAAVAATPATAAAPMISETVRVA
ncbi:MAG: ComF family protein [Desertimonas sp.]